MKGILKCIILFYFCLLTVQKVSAQKYVDENSTFLERLYFGGNFGLALGNNLTNIEISPLAGYMINNKLSAGAGIIYQYFKVNRVSANGTAYALETNIYGGRLFGRYNFTEQLFAYSEFESISLEVFQVATNDIGRQTIPSFFVGAGYFMPIGRSAGITGVALYNLLYDPYTSPYNSPIVLRVGFTF